MTDATRVAFASSAAGAVMGALAPAYHVAIEPAQVWAGLVSYPPGNPFHLYELRLWTIWHQILAPLLYAGVSEHALTIALSAFVGAILFLALAMTALAYGASTLLALAVPFAMVLLVSNPDSWGFNYPLLLLGYGHTYGMLGLSWILLVCALLGGGWTRAGAFLLGLAPAVHASLGALLGLVVGICALFGPRELRRPRVVGSAAAGLTLSVASLLAQRLVGPVESQPDPHVAAEYLATFLRVWDSHRQPLDLGSWNLMMVWGALLLAIVVLRWRSDLLPTYNRLSIAILVACGLLGFAADLWLRTPFASAAPLLSIAMPTRLLNLLALSILPIVVALCYRMRERPSAKLLLLAIPVFGLARSQSSWLLENTNGALALLPLILALQLARTRGAHRVVVLGVLLYLVGLGWQGSADVAVIGLAAAIAAVAWFVFEAPILRGLEHLRSDLEPRIGRALAGLTPHLDGPIAIAFGTAVFATVVPAVAAFPTRLAALVDRDNDTALAAAAQSRAMLLAGPGIGGVQLRTRRPVLLDPEALDMLPYATDGGVEIARILDDVYGVDFFAPPASALHMAVVPDEPVLGIWEKRSVAEWIAVGARFGVSDVLVKPEWRLRLPEVARSEAYTLYRIPPRVVAPAR